MLSEREFLELLKNKNLIPEGNYQHFSQVVGIVKWNSEELISSNKTKDEVKEYIEADSLEYLAIDDLKQAIGDDRNYSLVSFDGDYFVK